MSARPDAVTPAVALDEWLAGPFGRLLIEAERTQRAAALEDVFGAQFIQRNPRQVRNDVVCGIEIAVFIHQAWHLAGWQNRFTFGDVHMQANG